MALLVPVAALPVAPGAEAEAPRPGLVMMGVIAGMKKAPCRAHLFGAAFSAHSLGRLLDRTGFQSDPVKAMHAAHDALLALPAEEGNRLFDICGTVEDFVVGNGFSIVREYVGHGIGTQLHEEPQVPNYVDRRNENPRLREGMVLAIEPMVNAGKPEAVVLKDKWTAVAKDKSYSAHFEHCVAVTANGPWVLTRP